MSRRTLFVAVVSCLSMTSGLLAATPVDRPASQRVAESRTTVDVRISAILNREVADASGAPLGRVQDVVLNPVLAKAEWVIIATNASATQPAGRVAVPWTDFTLPKQSAAADSVRISMAHAIPLEGSRTPRLPAGEAIGWQRTWRVLHGCDVRAIDGVNIGGVDDAVIDATGHVECVAILLSGVRTASDRRIVLPMDRVICTPNDASVRVVESVTMLVHEPTLPPMTVAVAVR